MFRNRRNDDVNNKQNDTATTYMVKNRRTAGINIKQHDTIHAYMFTNSRMLTVILNDPI